MRFDRAMLMGAVLVASAALATPTFTGVMQNELGMSGPPPGVCAVCHLNGVTTTGTVTTPFGRAMRMNGLMPNNDDSLKAALAAIDMANTDSDMDGCTDIAELKAMPDPTNPNRAGDCGGGSDGGTAGGTATLGPIRYGCGANSVPGVLGLVGVLALLARRRR